MKIKYVFLVYLLFWNILLIYSQPITFDYTLSSKNDEKVFDLYEDTNGDIYFCGGTAPPSNNYYKSMLVVKLDKFGNEVNNIVYTINGRSVFARQLLRQDTDNFVLTACSSDTLITRNQIAFDLYNMDLSLNLSNETHYHFDSIFIYSDAYSIILSNGNIVSFISTRIHPQAPKSYLYLFNDSFDSLNSIYYPVEARTISHIHELPDRKIWTLNLLLSKYELLDTTYNIIDTQRVPNSVHGNYGVTWDSDTTFFLLGKAIDPDYHNAQNLSYIKQYHPIDTTGYLFNYWRYSDTIDFPATWNGIDLNNNDSIFIGGTVNLDFYNPWYGNQPSWFVILQTDSLLNKRWEQFYGGDAYYVMTNLIASNDGGCIVAGQRYDYLNVNNKDLDIVILKLNNEGLITNVPELNNIKMQEAIVYPNPGINEIIIKVAVQYQKSTFILFDMNGNPVLSENIVGSIGKINTTDLKPATYIYKIVSKNGLYESGSWIKF